MCSQAVLVDRTLYISGQLGLDPQTGNLVTGGVQSQAQKALENMGEILKESNASFSNVVKTTVLLANIDDFVAVNDVYKQFFSSQFPARAAYQVAALPKVSRVTCDAFDLILLLWNYGLQSSCHFVSSHFPRSCQGATVEIEAVAIVGEVVDKPFGHKL
uniref:Reactive intermediate imine deaminase A homolog n=1 Tax=Eptatretus burgeri TaxID=7764 RepID=A0A8C4NNH7_EPTBU